MARMRGNREVTLTAKAGDDQSFPVYANRVDIMRSATTENYLVASLSVNFGPAITSFSADYEEKSAIAFDIIAQGGLSISNGPAKTLLAHGPNGTKDAFYSIDLEAFVPEGWDFEVTKIGTRLRQIGIIAYKPGHFEDLRGVHILGNEDLHEAGEELCESVYKAGWGDDTADCQRGKGHRGSHQSYERGFDYEWDTGGSSRGHNAPFGFTCRCPYCGHVDAGPATGVKNCFGCDHWLYLEKNRDENSFVIAGRHYRPGAGGFGGWLFNVRRNDGTTWEGELFTQGEVPSWMADRLPDNAEFIVKEPVRRDSSGEGNVVYSGSLADVKKVAWAELRKASEEEWNDLV